MAGENDNGSGTPAPGGTEGGTEAPGGGEGTQGTPGEGDGGQGTEGTPAPGAAGKPRVSAQLAATVKRQRELDARAKELDERDGKLKTEQARLEKLADLKGKDLVAWFAELGGEDGHALYEKLTTAMLQKGKPGPKVELPPELQAKLKELEKLPEVERQLKELEERRKAAQLELAKNARAAFLSEGQEKLKAEPGKFRALLAHKRGPKLVEAYMDHYVQKHRDTLTDADIDYLEFASHVEAQLREDLGDLLPAGEDDGTLPDAEPKAAPQGASSSPKKQGPRTITDGHRGEPRAIDLSALSKRDRLKLAIKGVAVKTG